MATGATTTATDAQWQTWGLKEYELDNHLGNVMATINDRRIQVPNGNNLDHFEADVVNAQDYFAFGMQQPGRIYTANPTAYRYGFNGQEKSLEIDANGNHNTALFWEYDTRLGRRWDLDPKPNPGVSSYSAFNNNPINNNDLLGDTISNRSDWSRAGASVFVNLYLNAIKGRSDPNRNCNMCCLNAIASNLSVCMERKCRLPRVIV